MGGWASQDFFGIFQTLGNCVAVTCEDVDGDGDRGHVGDGGGEEHGGEVGGGGGQGGVGEAAGAQGGLGDVPSEALAIEGGAGGGAGARKGLLKALAMESVRVVMTLLVVAVSGGNVAVPSVYESASFPKEDG